MTLDTRPLTFGDTFTLPATGDAMWRIIDYRPHSYQPPENLSLPGRETIARAQTPGHLARYEVGVGWSVYGGDGQDALITAQLNELDVQLDHRTDDEWRALILGDIAHETKQSISVVGGSTWTHELFSPEEITAHIAATAAVTAAKTDVPGLYDAVYDTTLNTLRA